MDNTRYATHDIPQDPAGEEVLRWGALVALVVETCLVVGGIVSAFMANVVH